MNNSYPCVVFSDEFKGERVLETGELPPGSRVCFTFHGPAPDKWEGTDFEVIVESDAVRTKDVTAKPTSDAFINQPAGALSYESFELPAESNSHD